MPDGPTTSPEGATLFESRFAARSYELDSFAHVNHAVFLNWLEQARFEAFESGGYPPSELVGGGWAVVVARVEIDFEKEVLLGDEVVVRTRVEEIRRTSMTVHQDVARVRREEGPGGGREVPAARARVVLVWLRDGKPERVPPEVAAALGVR